MLPVFRAADVRAADQAAVAAGTSVATLMQRAGWAVASAASAMLGGAYGKRIAVVCGIGNNAGDGLTAARVLTAWGASVDVVAGLGESFSGDAASARRGWHAPVLAPEGIHDALERADLILDALFGTGLSRDLDGIAQKLVLAINGSGTPVLAVDVPSGIDADTGQVRGDAIRADATVTFGAIKPGLVFAPGRTYAGDVSVVDIGLPELDTKVHAFTGADAGAHWPHRATTSNKRSAGSLLLVAGSEAMPGAAVLAARAAVAAGVGLLYVAIPRSLGPAFTAACPEALHLTYDAPWLDAAHAHDLVAAAERVDAIAIGPGIGREVGTLAAVRTLLERLDVPAVVDADALRAIPVVRRDATTIVTPHAGEWSVITEREPNESARDRLAAAEELVMTLVPRVPRVIGVLKGPGTVTASMDAYYIDLVGGPELSQGGTGDVLTGMLGAMAAVCGRADAPPSVEQVAATVWIHSRAGRIAIETRGTTEPLGSSRIIEAIPNAIGGAR